ncbi:DUF6093 family protein [Microbacterium terrisoli]|jgi:hypothetical protein|uniref:DUF6093 family protein n=1 Tax=Microbacterium terrisoli TaxID=3242192 RepID=UPI0028048EB1|nr:DUF6093 family protein [Microbacterium protaetiae]
MSLGSDTQTALAYLRAEAESRFTETLRFTRVGTVDDANGVPVPGETTLYEVPGRVKFTSQVVSPRESGAQLVVVQQRRVDVAVGSTPGVRPGDVVTVTASTVDAGLVGRKFTVDGLPDSGQVTAARYPVSEGS